MPNIKIAICVILIICRVSQGFALDKPPQSEQIDGFTVEELNYLANKKELIVICDEYFPPFEYKNYLTGQVEGFNIDFFKAIAANLKLTLKIKPTRWESVIPNLLNKDCDLIAGILRTPGRLEIMDFSDPYIISVRNIFVNKNNKYQIDNINQLKNLKVAVQKGDVCENLIKSVSDVNVIFTQNQKDGLLYLENNLVDAFVGNKFVGLYLIKSLQLRNIRRLDKNMFVSDYCIGLRKNEPILKNILNKSVNRLKISQEYDRIYQKWFVPASDIYPNEKTFTGKLLYIVMLGLALLVIIFAISLTWIWSLKKGIKRQTRKILEAKNEALEQHKKLAAANEQLQKLDSMKDNFISNVSHELKTPLVSILGYLNLMIERKLGDLTDRQEKATNIIFKNINKLLSIINTLLEITKSEEQMFKSNREYVDLTALIQNALTLYNPMIETRNIKVIFDYDKNRKFLLYTQRQLTEIIINNLVTNAIKYNKDGGSIFIELTKLEKFIILIMRDTGIGIDNEQLTKIFDRFYQIDNKITSNSGGLGLGLYLVKKYVTLLKSKIEVKSELNVGSEFKIYFYNGDDQE